MKTIMVMFDSLNRHLLPPYGGDWVHAPNFQRLAERSVTFDRSYIGSMPCMPARREIHTGRYNFLHRSWGPLEPFDDSLPAILRKHGVYTHLVSDHYHYWEEGGATYHTKYNTWEIIRGQEGDPWKGDLHQPTIPENINARHELIRQDWVNRRYMMDEEQMPQPKTFAKGLEFLRTNVGQDNWFLQIENFDPHEPYFVPDRFVKLYDQIDGPLFDWPPYASVSQTPEQIRHVRIRNAALISMCDEYLGKVLDVMDEQNLWADTMLIVNTDHGFLLGEHDCWAKCWCPWYEENAHTPLFVWDPRSGVAGQRRQSLVQTIDLAPTILDFFGIAPTADMQGRPLARTVLDDTPVREAGLFGIWGGQVNVTDGRYVYMRAPIPGNQPLFQYTHLPTHMRHSFSVEEMRTMQAAPPFSFSKGCPVMKIAGRWGGDSGHNFRTELYDVQADPQQQHPLDDPPLEHRMIGLLVQAMKDSDAPAEQYERLGLREHI